MHESLESKYTYTDIQNLASGQSIFISKDQKIESKLKMRYVKVNELVVLHKKEPMNIILDENIPIKPIVKVDLKKVVEYKENEQTKEKEKEEETSFDDIENLLQ